MEKKINRRHFVFTSTSASLAAAAPSALLGKAPTVMTPQSFRPLVISNSSGANYKNGGPVSCSGISPRGEICGLAFKIPGRVADSPIVGAGFYVDGEVGTVGSTGRGEANLYNLTSYLIVKNLRRGMHPKDAGMEGLKRVRAAPAEKRLLNSRGEPALNVRFYILNSKSEHTGVTLYPGGRATSYAACGGNGMEQFPFDALLSGQPLD